MERRNGLIRAKSYRLSSLPDEVLCHVLSFLPTKSSVKTSILAPRYRYLWCDVVNLDFDAYYERDSMSMSKPLVSFSDAVNRVLLLRNKLRDINNFRLVIEDDHTEEHHQLALQLDTWIRYAITCNVQAIDIQPDCPLDNGLPSCLFTCRTLVDLRLNCFGCGVPDVVLLPNLKKLHLLSFRYGSDKKFQYLISGCPVLEDLHIELIRDADLGCCFISSPTIKWLTLHFELDEPISDFHDYELVINTPELRYLKLSDYLSQHISAGVFNSLVEASITLGNNDVVDNNIYSDSVLEFVERLCQVKCLKFSSSHKQDYRIVHYLDSSFAAVTSKFINLTKLELGADVRFLIKFLECADNLQVLIIRDPDFIGEFHHNLECWTEPQQVPMCLSSNLRQVRVHQFGRGQENEFKMVSYILNHGKVLNEMKIYAKHRSTDVEKLNALRRISEFERGSQTCKLMFS